MEKNSIVVILIYVVFMAILILPTILSNKKKKKQKAELLESLKVGDKITTVGGIQGTLVNIFTETVEMKIFFYFQKFKYIFEIIWGYFRNKKIK